MRKAFADTLTRLAAENPRIIFLTGDLGFQIFDEFRARFGARFLNVGVAEAQLVDAAAGLALEGWKPVVYSIASFMTGRAFEQIRVSIGYHRLPIVVVGAGGGYTYAASGVTHHAADDLALMSLVPDMAVVAPGDPNEVTQLLPQLLDRSGPSYIRLGRFGEPRYDASEPARLGRARILRDGKDIAILSTGDMALTVLDALDVLGNEGIFPLACQMHTVKPLDISFLDSLAEKVKVIIPIEEHSPIGGLSAAISAWAAERDTPPRIRRVGPPDVLALGNFDRDELRRRLQYDSSALVRACQAATNLISAS